MHSTARTLSEITASVFIVILSVEVRRFGGLLRGQTNNVAEL